MFNLWKRKSAKKADGFIKSSLHDETTFYYAFFKDLESCKEEVIIESPFITNVRAQMFRPIFQKLLDRGVNVYIITRNPEEHDGNMAPQAEGEIAEYEFMGVQVLLCVGNHHRKLAFIDRNVLWEGSLNILSQTHSREFMRRIESKKITIETFNFLKFDQFI